MRKQGFLLINIVVVFLLIGCGAEDVVDNILDKKTTFLTVANSPNATWRIIDGHVETGDGYGEQYKLNMGKGIHKGSSKTFTIKNSKCDTPWNVFVSYNDSYRTTCRKDILFSCKMTNVDITFNNNVGNCHP